MNIPNDWDRSNERTARTRTRRPLGAAGSTALALFLGLAALAGADDKAVSPDAAAPTDLAPPAEAAPAAVTPAPGETLPDWLGGYSLENLGRLYKNEESPWVQELWVLGRYHGQYHVADGSAANDQGWENRRFRIGGQTRLFQKLTIHAQMVSGNDLEKFYNGFTELWAGWKFNDAVTLTIGQQKHRFTHDRNISSRYINYLERSMLTNMFGADYTPALTLSGKVLNWNYYTGVFSNATSKNIDYYFTHYNSGFSLLTNANHELGKFGKDGTAWLNLSYVYSDANSNATNLNRFDHGAAAALILTHGPMSLVTEFTAGVGSPKGDAYGINLQPGIFLTKRIQLVGRYQYAGSPKSTGLAAQRRYERGAGLTTGDSYNAGYLGLNYYLAEHRIKFMTGVEISALGGETVWTGSLMVRVFFGPHSRGPFPMAQVLQPLIAGDDGGDGD